jgi:hypothetical protein
VFLEDLEFLDLPEDLEPLDYLIPEDLEFLVFLDCLEDLDYLEDLEHLEFPGVLEVLDCPEVLEILENYLKILEHLDYLNLEDLEYLVIHKC